MEQGVHERRNDRYKPTTQQGGFRVQKRDLGKPSIIVSDYYEGPAAPKREASLTHLHGAVNDFIGRQGI